MIDNLTGPDPRESDQTRYDATLTMTIRITVPMVTSNATAEEDEEAMLDRILNPIEQQGAQTHIIRTNIEPQ